MIATNHTKPIRRPIEDADLLRLVDALIFGEQLAKLTETELNEARKSEPYRMMQRLAIVAYRAGEAGLRPKPRLMVVGDAPKAEAPPVSDEQSEPEPTTA